MLHEISSAMEKATWSNAESPGEGAVAYSGVYDGWSFLVVSFDISDQGFPPGSRGYDGTAVKGMNIIRLTREQAEKGWKQANAKAQ